MTQSIVIIVNELLRGGAQRIILDIASRIDKTKFSLHVVFLKSERIFPAETKTVLDEILQTGARVTSIGGEQRFTRNEFKRLVAFLRRERPAIVHTYLPYAGTVGRVAARMAGIKHIISTQCNLPVAYTKRVYWLDRLTLPLAHAWTGATEGIEQHYGGSTAPFTREAWDQGRRHFTIVAGVDTAKITAVRTATDRTKKRNELGIPLDVPLALMTARLISWKGHEELIAAMAKVPRAHLMLAGWGPLEAQLREQATALGIADRIHFLGARTDVYELLAAADLYIQTFSRDAKGNQWIGPNTSVIEAAAAGVPVVATRVPLIESLIEHEQTGFLANEQDPDDLAAQINRMIESPQDAARMSIAAQQRAIERYSLDRMVEQTEGLYTALLSHP